MINRWAGDSVPFPNMPLYSSSWSARKVVLLLFGNHCVFSPGSRKLIWSLAWVWQSSPCKKIPGKDGFMTGLLITDSNIRPLCDFCGRSWHTKRMYPGDLHCPWCLSSVHRTTVQYISSINPTLLQSIITLIIEIVKEWNAGLPGSPEVLLNFHTGRKKVYFRSVSYISNKKTEWESALLFRGMGVYIKSLTIFFYSNQKEFTSYYRTWTAKFMMAGAC